jgi:hypothetical protein
MMPMFLQPVNGTFRGTFASFPDLSLDFRHAGGGPTALPENLVSAAAARYQR